MEREQSFDESENSTYSNENVSQELHHVKSFHYLFLTFNNINNNCLQSPNNFDHEIQLIDDDIEQDSADDYNNDAELKKNEFMKMNDPSPLIPRKTKAQIWEDTVIQFIKFIYINI